MSSLFERDSIKGFTFSFLFYVSSFTLWFYFVSSAQPLLQSREELPSGGTFKTPLRGTFFSLLKFSYLTVKAQACHDLSEDKRFHIAHVPPGLNPGYAVHGPIITKTVWTQKMTRVQCAQISVGSKASPKIRVK